MNIITLWKAWDDDSLELLFAVDEYTSTENPGVWEEGVKAALDRYKIVEADTRVVTIKFDGRPIEALFNPLEIGGLVLGSDKEREDD